MKIKDVVNELDRIGVDLSERTIRNYEKWKLIDSPDKEWLGRGRGSEVSYSQDTPAQAYAAHYMLKGRGLLIEQLQYVRIAGLRMVDEDLLGVTVDEAGTVRVSENNFQDYFKQVKEKVFFDISSYRMLCYYGDVSWWAWLYIRATMIMNGEAVKEEISPLKKLGPVDRLLSKLFKIDDDSF